MELDGMIYGNKRIVYIIDGKKYLKLKKDEVIKEGAVHCYNHQGFYPVMHKKTIGDKPSSFSEERDFFNLID